MRSSLWDLPAYVCVCVPTVVKWAPCCCSLRWSPLLGPCHWVRPLKACCQWVARKRREKLSSSAVTLYLMSHITLSAIPPSLSLCSYFSFSHSFFVFSLHPIFKSPEWLSSCPSPSSHFHLFSVIPFFSFSFWHSCNPQVIHQQSTDIPLPPFPFLPWPSSLSAFYTSSISVVCSLFITSSLSQQTTSSRQQIHITHIE